MKENLDARTVEGFGDEWERFDQSALSEDEFDELFNRYFSLFPWEMLPGVLSDSIWVVVAGAGRGGSLREWRGCFAWTRVARLWM